MITTKQLLVVEDDSNICNLLTLIFQKAGHQVTSANTGTDGLTCITRSNFDLVILDMTLPDMNGKQFLTELHHKGSPVPVVLTSGDPALFVLDSQVMDALSKPFSIKDMLDVVQRVC
jgi:DNA-binding response OmpR family regulator